MTPRIRSLLPPGAALFIGAMILLNGITYEPGPADALPSSPVDGLAAERAAAVVIADERESLLARPIFTISRKPPPAVQIVEPVVEEAAHSRAQFVVQGIARSADRIIVHVLDPATRKIRRLGLGQEIGGWRIAEVDATGVTFARNDARDRVPITRIRQGTAKTPRR